MATVQNGNDSGNNAELAGQMRQKLSALLSEKERQLQQAEALSQRILTQQLELEERINQIAELDEQHQQEPQVESEMRAQLDDLAQTMHGWATENETLWAGAVSRDVTSDPSAVGQYDAEPQRTVHTPSAAQSSRRAKNAAHRANDAEFAFEIGSGLITEIRRLQSLLTERDKTLQDMKEEKDDLERAMENLQATLRTQEANSDKYREENWNLEVQLQDLRSQLNTAQSASQRSDYEYKRLQKEFKDLQTTSEQQKTDAEKMKTQLGEQKAKHDTEVANMRRQVVGLQKEKGEMQIQVESLKAEAQRKNKFGQGKFGSSATTGDQLRTPTKGAGEFGEEEEGEPFGTVGSTRKRVDSSLVYGDTFDLEVDQFSPNNSPIKAAVRSPLTAPPSSATNRQSAAEIEALQQQLEAAQKEVDKFKRSLAKEQQLRVAYGKQLEEHGVATSPVEDRDEDYEDDSLHALPRVAPSRNSVGLGRRTVNPMKTHRTNLLVALAKANAKSARQGQHVDELPLHGQELEEADFSVGGGQDDWVDMGEEQPPRRSIDSVAASMTEESGAPRRSEDLSRRQRSQSAVSISSSMDGMDPAYANVLKNRDSARMSSDLGHGPIDNESPVKAGARTGGRLRGVAAAAAMPDSRPGSIMNAPGTLASELGGFGGDGGELDDERLREELGIEDIEPIESSILGQTIERSLLGHGIDEEDEEPEQPETPVKARYSIFTAAQPVPRPVERIEMGIQCELIQAEPPAPAPAPAPEPTPAVVEPTPAPVPVIEKAEMSIQTDEPPAPPAPAPAPVTVDGATQTEIEVESVAVGTEPAPAKVYAEMSSSTEDIPSSPPAKKVPVEILAGAAVVGAGAAAAVQQANVGTSTATNANKRASLPPSSFRDPTATKARPISRADTVTTDGGDTEYEDARETMTGTTPYQSVDNFGESGEDESESDSAESIKVSRMHVKRPSGVHSASGVGSAPGTPTATETEVPIRDLTMRPAEPEEEEEGSKRDTVQPPKPTVVEEPKPELKDESIQTDEWIPPLPASTPLFTVGPQAQQFQFIPPSAPTGVSSIALPSAVTALKTGPTGAGVGQLRSRVNTSTSASGTSIGSGDERTRVPSAGTLSVPSSPKSVDRTRPPMMILPPPPRLPPPPSVGSPGATTTTSNIGMNKPGPPNMGPPPRPTSPPPPELIQRATTPTIGRNSTLLVPGRTLSGASRSSAASASQGQGRQVRSAVVGSGGEQDVFSDDGGKTQPHSMASLSSSRRSFSSRRPSISSSISSADHGGRVAQPSKTNTIGSMATGQEASGTEGGTDPTIIHAITQTMIGEYLYKYTRRPIGKKHAERRHKRYFWIHPYTKTIYWSEHDPGSSGVTESSAKSAYIESVKSVMDPNPMPPGLHQYSVVVTTANREMKFTAPTKERHEIWYNALTYLLARPTAQTQLSSRTHLSPAPVNQQQRQPVLSAEEARQVDHSPKSPRMGGQSALTVDSYGSTPRARSVSRMSNPYGSVGKRSGTAAAEFMRWNGDAPVSPPRSIAELGQDGDFQINDEPHDAYDGLENVRACCDGKHDVGNLSTKYHHHPNQHNYYHQQGQYTGTVRSATGPPLDRPGSPSGWSNRSSRSKAGSHEGGMFSWSRRSRQTSAVRP